MKYENARDILPPNLLRIVQRFVSGQLIYIPAAENRRWGEASGLRQQLRDRNRCIRHDFTAGESIDALAEKYQLSDVSIRHIVYTKKEEFYLDYMCTLSNAIEYADHGMIEDWIHAFLLSDGNNKALSDGLKWLERIYHGPVSFPLDLLVSSLGNCEDAEKADADSFEQKVSQYTEKICGGADLPPLIVHYRIPAGETDGELVLNDGYHRLEAFNRLGAERYYVIFWCTEQHEYDQMMERYGHLME